MGLFLGNFNNLLDSLGVSYYWNAVGFGLFVYSVLFLQQYRGKIELKKSTTPLVVAFYALMGVFGLPISASILTNELSFIPAGMMQIFIPAMALLIFITSAISFIKFNKKR